MLKIALIGVAAAAALISAALMAVPAQEGLGLCLSLRRCLGL